MSTAGRDAGKSEKWAARVPLKSVQLDGGLLRPPVTRPAIGRRQSNHVHVFKIPCDRRPSHLWPRAAGGRTPRPLTTRPAIRSPEQSYCCKSPCGRPTASICVVRGFRTSPRPGPADGLETSVRNREGGRAEKIFRGDESP